MQYWTVLYTWQTWQEFHQAGGKMTGFPERRWATVQKIAPGDLILCYLIGISRYIGILEVTEEPFKGYKPIWTERVYPCRVPVKVSLALLPEYGVPVTALSPELSTFKALKDPQQWWGHFRSSPIFEQPADGEAIVAALENASEDPVFRAYDPERLHIDVPLYETASGIVTVPDDDPTSPVFAIEEAEISAPPVRSDSTHDEIQWLLLTVGSKMGLDVWVARNDRGRSYAGEAFQAIPRLKTALPRQFDDASNRTIELIDVLWLKDNAILAAFEIEHTSTVYSGLLRMADLVAMQPNLNIRLYIVAPDERRDKVFSEINRPTFSKMKPPLNAICQYIAYSALKQKVEQVRDVLRYLQPEFLNEISETFEADI